MFISEHTNYRLYKSIQYLVSQFILGLNVGFWQYSFIVW